MSSRVRIVPWFEGASSLYAVVRDGICLPDEFLERLHAGNALHAERLTRFLVHILHQDYVRPSYLRPELPELGVYAMYNHREMLSSKYNPSRLLCRYIGSANNIILVGSGFVKTRDEAIQRNGAAHAEALFLSNVGKELDNRIQQAEISIVGSQLIPISSNSFTL